MRRLLLVDEVLFISAKTLGTELTTNNSLTLALTLALLSTKETVKSHLLKLYKTQNRRIFSALSFFLIGVL